ncbi:MAG: hypothetical protein IT433_11080 [Phycisphaerales bacterium]|nr:hypothetical protein [Phycisphaerales bacterium]
MSNPRSPHMAAPLSLYDGEGEKLLRSEQFPDRVTLLPGEHGSVRGRERIRILWGQDLLRDLLDGRYRTVICGVNDRDNSHGLIAQIVELVQTSQWSAQTVTNYARMFQESVALHSARDREPYVLKFDLDSLLILAILRPRGKEHFTLDDLGRGFQTVAKMLHDRRERWPAATVSFLNAKANRLVGADGQEPSFEAVLRTIFNAGYRGDVYTAPAMWRFADVGVFPTYPFPEGLERMRTGSS